jgi:outer membrane protein assembly factor BamE (lipoprotein component of BamABCDE complex)
MTGYASVMPPLRFLSCLLSTALLAGCALRPYSPSGVSPGASRAEVERVMGAPTGVYAMPDGHVRLEYNHMPFGKHTFMIDLDASGRVAHWENVLDEKHFDAIRPGQTMAEVLRQIGPPSTRWHYVLPRPGGTTWLYRFETIQRCVVFELSFDAVTATVLDGAYPPDPGCPDEWM